MTADKTLTSDPISVTEVMGQSGSVSDARLAENVDWTVLEILLWKIPRGSQIFERILFFCCTCSGSGCGQICVDKNDSSSISDEVSILFNFVPDYRIDWRVISLLLVRLVLYFTFYSILDSCANNMESVYHQFVQIQSRNT